MTPEDIHNLADNFGISWDNDPNFMDYSRRITGKRHLDDMNSSELEQLAGALSKLHEHGPRAGAYKGKRILYHAGQRPAAPKPKARWLDRGQGDNEWMRYWLDSPVKSGVFLTPNPVDIAQFHGVSGNVYAYRVPEWVIKKSGGIHRYDKGSEILIPEDVWEEAGSEIEFLGKSMSQQELWDKIDMSLHGRRGRSGNPQKPGWMSTEEWQQYRAADAAGNHLIGLRNTKHLEQAVKMMTPTERAEALEAFEQVPMTPGQGSRPDWVRAPVDDWDRPRTEKDLEIMAALRKYMNESLIRSYMNAVLAEAFTPNNLPDSWYVEVQRLPVEENVLEISIKDIDDEYNKPIGYVAIVKHEGDCDNAWEIMRSNRGHAPPGAGSMLYSIALEIAGQDGLMSDREEVSGAAKRVWDKIHASGISSFPLDSDCNKNITGDGSLSNRYVTSGTPTIDRLKALDKWKDVGEIQENILKDFIKLQMKHFDKKRYNKIKKLTLSGYWDQLYG